MMQANLPIQSPTLSTPPDSLVIGEIKIDSAKREYFLNNYSRYRPTKIQRGRFGPLPGNRPSSKNTESLRPASPSATSKKTEEKKHVYKGYLEAKERKYVDYPTRLRIIMSEQTNSSLENLVYPDYYGGVYIDDAQRMVVLITELLADSKEVDELKERLGHSNVVYCTCKNSYNSLKQVEDSIMAQFDRRTPLALNIGMFGIYDSKNKIGVHLTDASEEKQQELFDAFGEDKVMITGYGPITIIDQ